MGVGYRYLGRPLSKTHVIVVGVRFLTITSCFLIQSDIDDAVAAAKLAFARNSEWRTMSPTQRARLMGKVADLIERDAQYLGVSRL